MAKIVVLVAISACAYLLLWPVEIDPVAWQPPAAPTDDSRYAVNDRLAVVQRIAQGVGRGPEAVNVDGQGRVVTGFIDGRVMRFAADGSNGELLADTGGRPLGLDFARNGDLIVTDAVHGLIRVFLPAKAPAAKNWEVIADSAAGVAMGFADDVDVSSEDVAYYSDASVKFGVHQVMEDFFEHRPNGRVLATDLATGKTTVLISDLHFANGIALGPNEDYLLITETAEYRVLRHWLKGPKAGQTEVFIENLPGFPDNITYNGTDTFWLAIYAPRTKVLDDLLPQPFLRKVIWRLPRAVQPGPVMHAFAFGLSVDGEVRVNLQDASDGAFAPITSVRQHGDMLYFGSLSQPSLARLSLKASPAH